MNGLALNFGSQAIYSHVTVKAEQLVNYNMSYYLIGTLSNH